MNSLTQSMCNHLSAVIHDVETSLFLKNYEDCDELD